MSKRRTAMSVKNKVTMAVLVTTILGSTILNDYSTLMAMENNSFDEQESIRNEVRENVVINETNFPDETFRNWILNTFEGRDGILTSKEIESFKNISIDDENVTSLKGIEYFTSLVTLACYGNLTSIDLSKNILLSNLTLYGNQLTTLDLSNNKWLETLNCSDNALTSLDLTNNKELTRITISNNQLIDINLSFNTKLTYLNLNNNQLKDIDLSKNTQLAQMDIGNNPLRNLDISKNIALVTLDCNNCTLTNLNVENNILLDRLYFNKNAISNIDLSKNKALRDINCEENLLTNIDLSNNTKLSSINCGYNQLSELDISQNAEMANVKFSNNKIKQIDLRNNPLLRIVNGSKNELYEIDVTNNPKITQLDISFNQIKSLDISKNSKLEVLNSHNNKLASLDLSVNANARKLALDTQNVGPIEVMENANKTWSVDLNQLKDILGYEDFDYSRVIMNDVGVLDKNTGIVTYTNKPKEVNYKYLLNAVNDKTATMSNVVVSIQGADTLRYAITYHLDGGKMMNARESYGLDELPLVLENPTKVGYRFIGWTGTTVNTPTKDYAIPRDTKGNLNFSANWVKETQATHTLTFDKNDGSADSILSVRTDILSGQVVDHFPTIPLRTGYEFISWNTKTDGSGTTFDEASVVNEDMTVYAQWKKIITVDKDDSTSGNIKNPSAPQTADVTNRLAWFSALFLSLAYACRHLLKSRKMK